MLDVTKINIEFIRKRCYISTQKRGNYYTGIAEVKLTGETHESNYHSSRTKARLSVLYLMHGLNY